MELVRDVTDDTYDDNDSVPPVISRVIINISYFTKCTAQLCLNFYGYMLNLKVKNT